MCINFSIFLIYVMKSFLKGRGTNYKSLNKYVPFLPSKSIWEVGNKEGLTRGSLLFRDF